MVAPGGNQQMPAQPATAEPSWTLGALLEWTAKHLAHKGVEFPRLDAEVLLAHAAGCKRIDLYGMRYGDVAGLDVRQRYRELIGKRLEGCPVAYLVGRKEFYGLEFAVSPAVLIPRPDTEHVVIEALKLAKKLETPRIVDVGTGSGAIAIALARHHPGAQITAIDISANALAVARANAEKHALAARIHFLEGDLLAPVMGETFDHIVSNPPYIPTGDIPALPIGVRQYEPHTALDGGPGGFDVFDRLLTQASTQLVPGGSLILEIGSPQEQPARTRIAALPQFTLSPTVFDSSRHPRVLIARRGA
jgi:release factor glutamine methyltransferase